MDFKKFKREVNKENIEIPQMKEEVKLYCKERFVGGKTSYFKTKKFNFRLSYSLITVLVLLLAVVIIGSSLNFNQPYEVSYKLESIKSMEDLNYVLNYENKEYSDEDMWLDGPAVDAPEDSEPGSPEGDPGSNKDDYTDTNIQEEGVKEADIVKTDGTRIYYINNHSNSIYSYNVETGELKSQKFIFYREMSSFSFEMYLNNEYVILTMEGYSSERKHVIGVIVLDKITFEEVKRYEGNGRKTDSRVIDNVLYFIYSDNMKEDKIPVEYIDNEEIEVECTDITYSREIINRSITFIVAMDLNTLDINREYMLGQQWDTIYSTKDSLYLCVTLYRYEVYQYTLNSVSPLDNFNCKTVIFRYEYDGINVE